MRVNFLSLVWIMLGLGLLSLLRRDYWMAGAMVLVAIFLFVVHRIRVRRFKRFDQTRNFD